MWEHMKQMPQNTETMSLYIDTDPRPLTTTERQCLMQNTSNLEDQGPERAPMDQHGLAPSCAQTYLGGGVLHIDYKTIYLNNTEKTASRPRNKRREVIRSGLEAFYDQIEHSINPHRMETLVSLFASGTQALVKDLINAYLQKYGRVPQFSDRVRFESGRRYILYDAWWEAEDSYHECTYVEVATIFIEEKGRSWFLQINDALSDQYLDALRAWCDRKATQLKECELIVMPRQWYPVNVQLLDGLTHQFHFEIGARASVYHLRRTVEKQLSLKDVDVYELDSETQCKSTQKLRQPRVTGNAVVPSTYYVVCK